MKPNALFHSLTAAVLAVSCLTSAPVLSLAADSDGEMRRYEFQSAHMGTRFAITVFSESKKAAEDAADAAFRRINSLEDLMSDYQADSELNLLSKEQPGKAVPVSSDLFEVLSRARKVSELSQGAFDPTIGPYVRLWRFARKRHELPSPMEIATARDAVGWAKLTLNQSRQTATLRAPNMRLDLGGIAKGYAADAALQILRSKGLNRALVAASGDIAIGDPPPGQRGWKIGISGVGLDAATNSPALAKLVLRNAGISTSGDTEQHIEIEGTRYSHIVSPRTGLGLTDRIQATVIAKDATTSDPLATAVCVMGVVKGLAMVENMEDVVALVVIEEDGRMLPIPSRGFDRIPVVE
jgi:thiamine biosynthesis lipoprotein